MVTTRETSACWRPDRKSTRLNSSHLVISYAVFCLKKKNNKGTATMAAVAPASLDVTAVSPPRGRACLRPAGTVSAASAAWYSTLFFFFFFFNDTATPEIYTLSLHDALPILVKHDALLGGESSGGLTIRGHI